MWSSEAGRALHSAGPAAAGAAADGVVTDGSGTDGSGADGRRGRVRCQVAGSGAAGSVPVSYTHL
ncbi:hypothetical protein, partial [Streptomyces sp. rh34]|uniref:hypothetical protein n=1 Tax=Streptomyces sp. rh34 TaxID=2034272 RepID=UPI00359C6C10